MAKYKIQDEAGEIHRGTKHEMKLAFEVMTTNDLGCIDLESGDGRNFKELEQQYCGDWEGELELIKIIKTHR